MGPESERGQVCARMCELTQDYSLGCRVQLPKGSGVLGLLPLLAHCISGICGVDSFSGEHDNH